MGKIHFKDNIKEKITPRNILRDDVFHYLMSKNFELISYELQGNERILEEIEGYAYILTMKILRYS